MLKHKNKQNQISSDRSDESDLISSVIHQVDAIELDCPLPLLKMKQALNQANIGDVIFVKATDPSSSRDFAAYINMTCHQLRAKVVNKEYHYWITKRDNS